MAAVYQYRIWCETEQLYCFVWAEAAPTTCPNDPSHTINTDKTTIVRRVGDSDPTARDGKRYFTPDIFEAGTSLQFAGFADDPVNGRMEGPIFALSRSLIGDIETEFQFNDWIQLAGGIVNYRNGQFGDYCQMRMYAPASVITPNATGEGDCNLIDPGPPFNAEVLIVPAAGDGLYDLDYSKAVPVPSRKKPTDPHSGFYEWDEPDEGRGTVTPGVPGGSRYHLWAIELPLAKFAKLHLNGEGTHQIIIPSVAPQKVLPHWIFHGLLHNAAGGHSLEVDWILGLARQVTY